MRLEIRRMRKLGRSSNTSKKWCNWRNRATISQQFRSTLWQPKPITRVSRWRMLLYQVRTQDPPNTWSREISHWKSQWIVCAGCVMWWILLSMRGSSYGNLRNTRKQIKFNCLLKRVWSRRCFKKPSQVEDMSATHRCRVLWPMKRLQQLSAAATLGTPKPKNGQSSIDPTGITGLHYF